MRSMKVAALAAVAVLAIVACDGDGVNEVATPLLGGSPAVDAAATTGAEDLAATLVPEEPEGE